MSGKLVFFDTNIICYAFDAGQANKREICKRLVERVLQGEVLGVVSNQVLGEIFNASIRKLGLSPGQATIVVREIIGSAKWRKVNYTEETINRAIGRLEESRRPFWDLVILETARENGVEEIVTENERDFVNPYGIRITNPFR